MESVCVSDGHGERITTVDEHGALHVKETAANRLQKTIGHADLSADVLDLATSGDSAFRFVGAFLRADPPITEAVSLVFDSKDGVQYDTTLASGDLSSDSDWVLPDDSLPSDRMVFASGDQVRIKCSNDNATGDVFATIITENI